MLETGITSADGVNLAPVSCACFLVVNMIGSSVFGLAPVHLHFLVAVCLNFCNVDLVRDSRDCNSFAFFVVRTPFPAVAVVCSDRVHIFLFRN